MKQIAIFQTDSTGKLSKFLQLKSFGSIINKIFIGLIIILCTIELQANVIFVNGSATGTNDGSSWANAYTHLESAILLSNVGDEIWVASGIYMPPLNGRYVVTHHLEIYGGFIGNETLRNQRDFSINETTLTGNGSNIFHFLVSPLSVLDGFTLSGSTGFNTSIDGQAVLMGSVFIDGVDIKIKNCTFFNNSAQTGAAIFCYHANATIDQCTFESNQASHGGGALYIWNRVFSGTPNPIITNCFFTNNSSDQEGGAIYNDGRFGISNPIITNCFFTNNSANKYGGAIFNLGVSGISNPMIENCTFTNNSAEIGGGAIYNDGFRGESNPNISSCNFSQNTAGNKGGAIYNFGFVGISNPRIENCTFTNNSVVEDGGAIYNDGTSGGNSNPTIENCTFTNNSAEISGGAISNDGSSGISNPTIENCTFTNNSAEIGGGAISNDGSSGISNPIITNCIFSNNNSNRVGGAIYNDGFRGESNPNISSCNFSQNTAGRFGGAIINEGFIGNSNPTIENCTFTNNSAIENGGAVYNGGSSGGNSNPMITQSLFTMNSAEENGGAIYNDGSSGGNSNPTIENCTFANNSAVENGGAVYNASAFSGISNPTISNCTFTNNSAVENGGAIYNDGTIGGNSNPTIENCTFTNNSAVEDGGAIFNDGSLVFGVIPGQSNPTIEDCVFNDNAANIRGGAIISVGDRGSSNPKINTCEFNGNTALIGGALSNYSNRNGTANALITNSNFTNNTGGAIRNESFSNALAGEIATANAEIKSCKFLNNSNNVSGGAITNIALPVINGHSLGEANVTVENCIFDSNATNFSGGAFSSSTSISHFSSFTNCLFSRNNALNGGGAVDLSSKSTFVNCTFTENQATNGNDISAGIPSNGKPQFFNCILYNSENSNFLFHTFPSGIDSIIFKFCLTNYPSLGSNPENQNNSIAIDPAFNNIGDPDGLDDMWGTQDDGFNLSPCSFAVNTGSNSLAGGIAVDITNEQRIFNSTVDRGAYELQKNEINVSFSGFPQNPSPACSDSPTTFTVNPIITGGTIARIEWKVNGNTVQDGIDFTFTSSSLNNGDIITAFVYLNECPTTFRYSISTSAIIKPTPNAVATPSVQTICTGSAITTIVLSSSVSGTTFNWTRDNTINVTGIAASGSGNISGTLTNTTSTPQTVTFMITPTANGCTGSSITATVLVNPKPTIIATVNPNPVCQDETAWFEAKGGVSFAWSGPEGFHATGSRVGRVMSELSYGGVYTVTVTSSVGCTNTATVSITVNPRVNATVSVSPNPACSGQAVQFTATGGTRYEWKGPFGFSSTLANPTITNVQQYHSGTYTVAVSNSAGCSKTLTVNLTVNQTPAGKISYDAKSTCVGSDLKLFAAGGATYSWTGPGGWTSTLQNPVRPNVNTSHSGVYQVVISSMEGCSVTLSVNITIRPLPTVTAWTTTPIVCEGSTAFLFSTGANSYSWSGPYGYTSNFQNPIIGTIPSYMSGNYVLTGSNEYGCTNTATVNITVQSLNAQISATPNPVPYGATVYLTASGGQYYQWTGPNGFNTTQQNPIIYKFTAINQGMYTCIISNDAGCQDTKMILINLRSALNGDNPQLVVTSTEGTYHQVYPNPATDQIRLDDYSGLITYQVFNANGTLVLNGKTAGTESIKVDPLVSGTYYIQWNYTDQQEAKSFISRFVKID